MGGESTQGYQFFLLLVYFEYMQSLAFIHFFLLFLYTLRYFGSVFFNSSQNFRSVQIDIPNLFGIRFDPLDRHFLRTNGDILLPIRNALTNIISKILDRNLKFPVHDLVDYLVKDINQTDDQEESLIWTVQNEAGEFPDELQLVVGTFSHFLFQILDGVAVEVGYVEIDVVFVQQVVVRI